MCVCVVIVRQPDLSLLAEFAIENIFVTATGKRAFASQNCGHVSDYRSGPY